MENFIMRQLIVLKIALNQIKTRNDFAADILEYFFKKGAILCKILFVTPQQFMFLVDL